MKRVLFLVIFPLSVLLLSFGRRGQAWNGPYFEKLDDNRLVFHRPAHFPEPVYDFKKEGLNAIEVELGRRLFYDPLLSKDSTISCASCHLVYTNFTHVDHALSHGIQDRIGTRNSLALVNLAWNERFMWDGAVKDIHTQAKQPITNPLEMNLSMEALVQRLNAHPTYRKVFQEAYPTSEIQEEQVLKALGQFMLTLVSANSKYDQVMRGEPGVPFTTVELEGYKIFQKHCAACHTEPLFTNNKFMYNGLLPDPKIKDPGRMQITGKQADSLKFKVPSLRNIEVSFPYMHDGRFRSLQMVVFHYVDGLNREDARLPKELRGKMNLSETDKNKLVAFLKTLTDHSFLKNPDIAFPRYVLQEPGTKSENDE
jgi:cytochrome c peroxidase